MHKLDIKSMTLEELEAFVKEINQPKFRALQIFKWLQEGCTSFDEMSNLSKNLRTELDNRCYIANVEIEKKFVSAIDGTVKYLYKLQDGEYIESVLMQYNHWYTVCASTQVGCRMGCKFCASGINGMVRNLTASEILSQITAAERDNGIKVSHVVLMGMGEPLDNFDNTVRFLELVSDDNGLNISPRHISVSTSGLVSGIYKLADLQIPVTLSISLHATTDEERSRIMPVNNRWGIAELIKSCKDYIKVTGRRISFEYALIEGVNDSDKHAEQLAKLLKGMICHVNLIPANPVVENNFKRPNIKTINRFKTLLENMGINATIRRTLGADINASCGQLRREHKDDLKIGGAALENCK